MLIKALTLCSLVLALAGCVDAQDNSRNPGNTGTGTPSAGTNSTDGNTSDAAGQTTY